jgi:hypothetical protein
LREKSWHSNQTNGILSSIDRKSLRDSNKWTSVGPGSFHMKKTMWAWAHYIYTLKMVFCFKKYSDLLWEKLLDVEKLYFVTQIVLTYCEKKMF